MVKLIEIMRQYRKSERLDARCAKRGSHYRRSESAPSAGGIVANSSRHRQPENIIPSGHRLPFGVPRTMKPASAQDLTNNDRAQNESDFFSSESALGILKLILAGSELSEVLTIIARLVESTGNGTLCTIWLPHADGKHLYCASGWAASGPCNPQRRNSRVGRRSGELSYCESTL
jgi:hypothetical protein